MFCFTARKGDGHGGGSDRQHVSVLPFPESSCGAACSGEPVAVQSDQHAHEKTDKHGAKMLAEFLEKDMLPEVRVKDDLQAKTSSLTQTREKLVQLRTVLKNKVNNLLAANFIVLKQEKLSTETGLRKALSFHFDLIADTEMFVVVEQIRSLNQSIEKLDKAIEDHGSKMDGFENLKFSLSWTNHEERQQNCPDYIGSMCSDRKAIQPVSQCLFKLVKN